MGLVGRLKLVSKKSSKRLAVLCIIEIPTIANRKSPLLQCGIPQFCNIKVEGFGTH
jgi:hypothetical protein